MHTESVKTMRDAALSWYKPIGLDNPLKAITVPDVCKQLLRLKCYVVLYYAHVILRYNETGPH